MVTYGYARVSTKEQNLDRQLKELKQHIDDERNIFCDKASGKNFDRKYYNALVGTENTAPMLRKGDLLIIMSIDRLGRNYSEIMEQWQKITQEIGADIKVLDMPLLDTSCNGGTLDKRFIADLVLQILSYVAEKERENIHKRQQQGIDAMPIDENGKKISRKTGKAIGRPTIEKPADWDIWYNKWINKEVTAVECMKQLGIKKNSFYKLVNLEK